MMCENCQSKQATVHLNIQINKQQKQVTLCQDCYEAYKQSIPSDFSNGFSSFSFEDFLIKPEFLNRFDNIIEFSSLDKDDLVKIVTLMLDELSATLTEQEISIMVTNKAKEKLASLGYHPALGARPLRRVIQEHVEDQITDLLLEDGHVTNVNVDVKNDDIVVNQ